MTKTQLIYQLDDINVDDGVDLFEIAPILMKFGELIRSANDVLGYDQKIDIRVKPFREGSWITEFVIQSSAAEHLLNYLKSDDGKDLEILLALLGLNVRVGITGVAQIIRFTLGRVSNFKNNGNETVTYTNEKDEEITVTLPEHRLVQSPLIQVNYYNSIVAPLEKFPTATGVTIKVDDGHQQKFTADDIPAFEEYLNAALAEDLEENITTMHGVLIKPKRGPYSGSEQAYSFIMGENNVLWPVTIEDQAFLNKLKAGDIRPYIEDVLKVDLEVRQKKDSSNKIMTHYAIVKVIDYIRYEKHKQLGMDDGFPESS